MAIKCSECNGIMKKCPVISESIQTIGTNYGNSFNKRRHTNIHLNINSKDIFFGIMSHLDDELIVVCSNFPECNNHYIMKKANFESKDKSKIGNIKIKEYGTHYYRK